QRQLQLLASPVPNDRKYAVKALGEIGASAPEVIPALLSTFSNPKEHALIRVGAAEALGRNGVAASKVVGAALIAVICNKSNKITVRRSAKQALRCLKEVPIVRMLLEAAIGDGEKITEYQVVIELMEIVDAEREQSKWWATRSNVSGNAKRHILLEDTAVLEAKVKKEAHRI